MLIEGEIQRLFMELEIRETVHFSYSGLPMTMSILDTGSKFALSSLVYEGGNYIPGSVRKCLSSKAIFPFSSLKTTLKIDEERFQISLHYTGPATQMNDKKFQYLLDEFNTQVEEWRFLLDEHDKNDLIHVRVN